MKPAFFYAGGTAYFVNMMIPVLEGLNLFSLSLDGQFRVGGLQLTTPPPAKSAIIRGATPARNSSWTLEPSGDPFPIMLDPDLWERRETINYPAAFLHIGACIDYGCDRLFEKVKSLKPGQKFGLGGYSQGAAVCGRAWNQGLKPGSSGRFAAYRDQWLGTVTFGSPVRQINHRGAGGQYGTWSGSWFNPAITTGCGGAFPASGSSHTLLTDCPDEYVDFTAPGDVFSSHGSSTTEQNWTQAIDFALGSFDPIEFANAILNNSLGPTISVAAQMLFPGAVGMDPFEALATNLFVDAAGMCFPFPGGGHTTYPMYPPCDDDGNYPLIEVEGDDGITYYAPDGKTCYQLAIEFMDDLAKPFQVAPILLPSENTAGWSTTLVPPAS